MLNVKIENNSKAKKPSTMSRGNWHDGAMYNTELLWSSLKQKEKETREEREKSEGERASERFSHVRTSSDTRNGYFASLPHMHVHVHCNVLAALKSII